jgi:hypothetical protein
MYTPSIGRGEKVSSTLAVRSAPPAIELTPDTLMFYCATQLRRLDGEITARMRSQQSTHDAQAILGELRERLSPYTTGGIGANDKHLVPILMQKLKAAFDALPEGSPQRAAIQSLFDKFRNTTCRENAIETLRLDDPSVLSQIQTDVDTKKTSGDANRADRDEVNQMLDSLKQISTDITSSGELEMINLQSLISQRQMAIQLTTNLLGKLNESLMAPIANLK